MDAVTVLFTASGVLAVAKPAGLATQAPPGCPSVEAWVRRDVAEPGGYVGIPHRLDRAVSGVLLVALTPRAARQLSRQFERRQVRKLYRAVVARPETGAPLDACGATRDGRAEWHDLVEKVPDEPRARLANDPDAPGVREAVTLARFLGPAPGHPQHGLLELEPLTGRMHQLRLQTAVRGMPIVGDELYGGPAADLGPHAGADPRLRPIALHAWSIAWTDPDTTRPLSAEAPLPAWWTGAR
jgi:23S rRNA pseudouridine1911/1915/1917 synthase